MKIAFCAPFYGAEAAGGAEAECRETALHLHRSGIEVEVFTTCLLDLRHDWKINLYPAGTTQDGGISVHRFPADRYLQPSFDRINGRIHAGEVLDEDDAKQYLSMAVTSAPLLRELARRRDEFDWICFIPYLFGLTAHGIELVGERSVLIPCLHDEHYARLPTTEAMFRGAGRIVFHTEAEQRLAHRLYDYDERKDCPIGEGVETAFEYDAARFVERFGLERPFILYAGRKDATKNTPYLVDAFAQWRRQADAPLDLVMIGPGQVAIPDDMSTYVHDLGYVSQQEKADAYAAATVFCQPSLNESFSIVLMEAWETGTPALVHSRCEVMRDHVVASGGGLHADTAADFAAAIDWLLAHPESGARMAQAGREYVHSRFAWPVIMERYRDEVFAPRA